MKSDSLITLQDIYLLASLDTEGERRLQVSARGGNLGWELAVPALCYARSFWRKQGCTGGATTTLRLYVCID
jgi:hypothetical protein